MWFSVALAILIVGVWVGYKAGLKIAKLADTRQRQKQEALHGAEWAHIRATESELSAIQTLQLFTGIAQNDKNLAKKYLLDEIGGLENLNRRPDVQEIQPVINLYLGLAYVDAAMAEEQGGNKESATKYMNSAQTLFQSLGWRDCSEDALKTVAKRELDKWTLHAPTRQGGK